MEPRGAGSRLVATRRNRQPPSLGFVTVKGAFTVTRFRRPHARRRRATHACIWPKRRRRSLYIAYERQSACKPGSVRPLQNVTTIPLGRTLPPASSNQPGRQSRRRVEGDKLALEAFRRPYSVLLPAGLAVPRTSPLGRCALTAPFHPYRLRGGLLSVALSLGSPPPDLIRRRVSVEPGLSSAFRQRPSSRLA